MLVSALSNPAAHADRSFVMGKTRKEKEDETPRKQEPKRNKLFFYDSPKSLAWCSKRYL
jgi:hypothetical protein